MFSCCCSSSFFVFPSKNSCFAQVDFFDDFEATFMTAIKIKFELPQSGISGDQFDGSWLAIGSGQKISKTVETSMITSTSETVTKEQSWSIGASISAGFLFFETEITSEYAKSISTAMEQTISLEQKESFTATCDNPSPTGEWYAYQWVMAQPSYDSKGNPGVTAKSNFHICLQRGDLKPQCPLGYCDLESDPNCQICRDRPDDIDVSVVMAPTFITDEDEEQQNEDGGSTRNLRGSRSW